jgi:hypothetical protein
MKIFRLPRRNRKLLDEETPLQRFFRIVLVLLLFGAVLLGFWLGSERRMEILKPSGSVQGQSLSRHLPHTVSRV